MSGIKLTGTGSYLPVNRFDNCSKIFKTLETSDEWIVSHTGIKYRHIANAQETTEYMAIEAARSALDSADIVPKDVDLIVVATTTNSGVFPACAVYVQNSLGCTCPAFDVQAVCAGFIFAVSLVVAYINAGIFKNVLVIGSERMSSIIDWNDRTTCVLFGDGAGAVLFQCTKSIDSNFFLDIHSDGALSDILYTPIKNNFVGKLAMNGGAVFRHAVEKLSSSLLDVLDNANKKIEDVDWFVPHQANVRIIDSVRNRVKLPLEKCIVTVAEHANTSAASIPLALDYANKANFFHRGDTIACSAIGGGLSWGSLLFEW
ncbi:Beta-ketoacyl-(acyl-carrier-protein) synthase III [Candidatus Xenohaliotis californiensis]|uniref:Beta-ketoacyl-[acyl-carrier-protein] synthase III n=1 Tax=Candidatus Xenohaliotis californiensis TaxID=84677 RepID=A0ABM9N9F5_9RICK|nr:Beta-ketoacyl-(acyl-carrier-protein) synthase III [Candidatus Xenohaliotis californiensis]